MAALVERGDEVVCLTRDAARSAAGLPAGVELVEADPIMPGDWQVRLRECDVVVNLAGEPVMEGLWTRGKKRSIRRSRLRSTFNVADALEESEGPRVLINASATGYYGDRGADALAEDSQPGTGFLARLACEWEHTAMQADSDRVRVAMIRVGIVLAESGGALPKLCAPFRFGLGGPLGNGQQYLPWVHIHDLVQLILFIIAQESVRGPVNACVPDPPTQKEFARELGRILGKSSHMPTPGFVLKMVLGEKAGVLLASQRVVPNVLKANGFKFRYGELPAALEDLLT